MRKFGHSESPYVAKEDLELEDQPGEYRDLQVTISHVAAEEQTYDGTKEEFYVLYFHGKKKGLRLNTTNEQALVMIFGDPSDGNSPEGLSRWLKDQTVTLYVDKMVMFGGKRVGGLRVAKAMTPPTAAPRAADEPPPPEQEHAPTANPTDEYF